MPRKDGFLSKLKHVARKPLYRSPYQKQLEGQVQELRREVEYQAYEMIDILSATAISDTSTGGNQYTEKKAAVDEIYSRFQNTAYWGCQLTQRVINQRRALVIPYGIKAIPSDRAIQKNIDYKNELEFVNRFIDFNNLQKGREDDLCRYAEMDGQMLVTFKWDDDMGDIDGPIPKIIRKSWYKLGYTVYAKADDDDEIDYIEWSNSSETQKIESGDESNPFVFVAFNDVDFVGMPAVGYILNECANLHKSLIGWRKMNSMFAKVTPFFEAETWEEAKAIMEWMQKKGWKVGTGAAGRDFKMVTPEQAPADMIYNEIKTNAQIISGSTGLPIHHLGFADVLANRATAFTLSEPMEVVMLTDMNKWNGFYEKVFNKAIELRNKNMNGKLRTGLIKPQLLPITDRQFQRLIDFWLPASEKGLVSTQLFLSQIPEIDTAEELENQRKALLSENKRQLESLFGEEEIDRQLYDQAKKLSGKSSDE